MRVLGALSISLLLLAACATPPAPVQAPRAPVAARHVAPSAADPIAAAIAEAREVLAERVANGLPGVSAAAAIDGKIVWMEGFGYADVETRRPVTPATIFRIGSVSKPLTALAVAQLAASGALDLDAPVQRYAPSFPRKDHPITARQLGGHLSGLRHYKGDEMLIARHYDTLTAALAIFQDDPLLFEPGTRYAYSSYGYNLLGVVIEGASGDGYLAYMKAHVFDPLGMTHTVPDDSAHPAPERTSFYAAKRGQVLRAPAVDLSCKWPSGGFLSNAEDLVRFGSALLGPSVLTDAMRSLLFTPMKTAGGKPTTYALGWEVDKQRGRRRFWHSGGSIGGTSYLALYPDDGVVVAVITNLGDAHDLGAEKVAEAFLDARRTRTP